MVFLSTLSFSKSQQCGIGAGVLVKMCTEGVRKGKLFSSTRQSFNLAFTAADEMNYFVCKSNLQGGYNFCLLHNESCQKKKYCIRTLIQGVT